MWFKVILAILLAFALPIRGSNPTTLCGGGARDRNIGWDCTHPRRGLYKIDGSKLSMFYSDQLTCAPCCLVRYGIDRIDRDLVSRGLLRNCPYGNIDDFCPHHSIGCPIDDVQYRYSSERKRRKCSIDEDCETIMDVSGDIANSGVNCWDTTRPKIQKIFCCNNRNVYTNVPICDGAPPAITTP